MEEEEEEEEAAADDLGGRVMSSFSRRRRIVANDGRMLGSSAQQSLTSLLQAIGQRGICGRSFWVPTAKTTCIAH